MIITYQPGTTGQPEVGTKMVDLGATAIAKYGDDLLPSEKTETGVEEKEKGKMDEMKEKMKQLRIASGETHGRG